MTTNMKRMLRILMAGIMLSVGLCGCASGEAQPRKTEFPDNAYKEIPSEYLKRIDNGGTVTSVSYEAKDYTGSGEKYNKTVLVYLPYGYDPNDTEKRYNVMYMMHGGGGNEGELLGGVMESTDMKKILDNMIANGDMEPCIFVGCTYNNKFNGDPTACCKNFYQELVNELIPTVEGQYNTYCEKTTSAGIKESRLHRGFGGFSMGAACTWWVFENALDYVGYYLPVAGDSWTLQQGGGGARPDETVQALKDCVVKAGYTKDDFYIYAGVGSNDDMAGPNMKPMMESMKKDDEVFIFCDNFKDGNCFFTIKDGGWHAQDTVKSLVYNALPKFFG